MVKDDKGIPLAKATVSAEGAKDIITATDGTFSFSIPAATQLISVSFAEYETQTINLKTRTNINIALKRSNTLLDSVVVVGYTTQKRRDVTGAISSVRGDDAKNIPTQNVAEALQGRVAGVEVIKGSGEPGGKTQITIRGVSSLNQPDPLYIIDGVRSSGNNVNPQDIASYDVLKDASAAAIYGAAAAGGVILITTKQGKGSTPTININSRYGITVPRLVSLLNKKDFVRYKVAMEDAGYTNASQAVLDTLPDFDWVKAIYKNGVEQNYNLSVSGSTPAVNYYLSGVHNEVKGVFIENGSTMDAVRLNTDVKISKSIKIGEQIYGYKRLTTPVKTSVVAAPFLTVPTGSAYSSDPQNPWGVFPFGFNAGVNLIAQVKTARFEFPEDNFQGNAYIEIKLPVKYMTFKTTVGYTSQNWENDIYYSPQNPTNPNIPTNTILYRNVGKYQQSLLASVLAYDHTWGAHTINVLGGFEQYKNLSGNIRGVVSPVLGTSFGYIPANGATYSVNGGYDPNGLIKSLFGRLNYDFSKKCM